MDIPVSDKSRIERELSKLLGIDINLCQPKSRIEALLLYILENGTEREQAITEELASLTSVVREIAESISEEYDPELTYAEGVLVRHDGKLYRSNVAITVPEPWTPEHWDQVDLEDEITAIKQELASHEADNTIHVTSAEKENWNAKYDKPADGIPKTDLSSGVQASLEKADSALQEHQSLAAYRTSSDQDVIDEAIKDDVSNIESLIPSQASQNNPLADKDFVNSSIGTNTAHYISDNGLPFTSVGALEAYTGTVTNNDYAFVTGTDESGNVYYDRYKATVSGSAVSWAKEYRLNNSSFTAAQWASISSGITALLVSNLESHLQNTDIHVTAQDKTNWNNKYSKPATGVPKTDLDSGVQESLGKADSAIQTAQGTANAGKVLKIGTDGNVTLDNEDVEVKSLTDGTMTLSAIKTMLDGINQEGRTVLFDTSSLPYDMIRCYISIVVENNQPKSYRVADQVRGKVSIGAYEANKTLADILSEAVEDFVTITVTCNTVDGATVTGQTVTLRNGSSEDAPIARQATYNGQPVTFVVPKDFVYFISASDTLSGHFNPNKVTGIAIHDTSVIITYKDVTSLQTAADIQAALNAGADLTAAVGSQITCAKNNTTLTWDIADYDSTAHEVTLLLHDTLPDQLVFEPEQALAYFENGLAAGDYKFLHSGKTYYLTLTTAIPAGGQLKASTTAFTTYESQDSSASLESGVVSETEIAGATSLGTTASGTLNHMDRVNYGSNNLKESALQWWLNTDAPASTLVPRTNKFSRAYRYSVAGLLNGLDPAFLACIADTVWKCATNQVYEAPSSMGGTVEKSTPYTITAKFCLASRKEIFGDSDGTPDGSTQFDLYVGATATDRKKYYNGSVRGWWLRSALPGYANAERSVLTDGSVHNYIARNSYGVVPACKIKKST